MFECLKKKREKKINANIYRQITLCSLEAEEEDKDDVVVEGKFKEIKRKKNS